MPVVTAHTDDAYWRDNFNTPLKPDEESAFTRWAKTESINRGRDILNDNTNYDVRGHWKDTLQRGGYNTKKSDDVAGDMLKKVGVFDESHFEDTYKKPNHPTFSNESKYSGHPDLWGGRYEGGQWTEEKGKWSYQPSKRMLDTTHTQEGIEEYFKKYEPDSSLVAPVEKGE